MPLQYLSFHHWREFLSHPRRQALAGALFTLAVLLPIWALLAASYGDSRLADRQAQVEAMLAHHAAALNTSLNQRLSLLNGLLAFVQAHPDGQLAAEADSFLGSLSAGASGIRRLTIAAADAPPLVYPAGDAPDPGLDDPATLDEALSGEEVVLDGPFDAPEGTDGPVLVGRQAVFLAGEYWGVVAVTLDLPALLDDAGLADPQDGLMLALQNADGQLLLGDQAVFAADPARYDLRVPAGTWTLAAVPDDGWSLQPAVLIFQATGLMVVLLVSALVMAVVYAALQADNTRRTTAEAALQTSEARFRGAFQYARVGMALLDLDGRFLQVNETLCAMLGLDETALLGTPLTDVIHPKDRDSCDSLRRQLLQTSSPYLDAELRGLHRDGQSITAQVSLCRVQGEDDPRYIVLQVDDRSQQKKVEDALWEQILRNEMILQTASDGFCVADAQGRILESNTAFAAITGFSPLELMDMHLTAIKSPDGEECLAQQLSVARENRAVRFEVLCQRPDGEPYHISASITLVDMGAEHFYFISLQNITERVQSEVELRKLSRAVQQSPASVVITDIEGNIEYVNPQFTRITGFTLAEALGQNPRILKTDHTSREEYEALWATITAGGRWQGEFLNRKKNGDLYWEFASISGVKDHEGRITHYIAVKEDITARKQVEAALRESQQRLTSIIGNTPVVLFALDQAGVFTLSEGQGLEGLGLIPGEVVGQSALDVYRDYPAAGADLRRALNGEAFAASTTVAGRTFDTHYTPLYDDGGALVGVTGVAMDVTGRQQAEHALREREERFRMITEHSLAGIFIIQDGQFVYVNPAFAQIFRYQPAEIVETLGLEMVHPEDQDLLRSMFVHRAAQESGPIFSTFRGVRKDGLTIHCEVLGSGLQYRGRAAVLGTLLDVTERREAEIALMESEYRFRTTADSIQHGLTIVEDQQIIYANDRVIDIYGLTREQYRTLPRLTFVAPEDKDRIRALTADISAENPPPPELEYWIVRPDGERRYIHNRYSVDRRQDGLSRWIVVTTDMTSRHQAEQALRESEARYRGLFEDVPISLWDEDMSAVKTYLDDLKAQGVADFRAYFAEHPAVVQRCAELIQVIGVNRATLRLYHANNFEELDQHLTNLIRGKPTTVDSFTEELLTLLDGQTHYSSETIAETIGGELRYLNLNTTLAPGHEASWERVLVSQHDITALKQAEAAEHAQRTLAESLRDTAAALTSTLDPDVVLRRILENVGHVVPHDAGNICLIEGTFIHFTHWQGYGEEQVQFLQTARIPLETPNFQQMFVTGQPFLLSDTRAPEHSWQQWESTGWIRSYAAAPIKTHGQVIGFLNLDSSQPGFFCETDVAKLAALADQAAIAIENAQLYNQIRLHAANLERRVVVRTAQLESERAQLQAILDAMGEGVVYAEDTTVRYVNQALPYLIGYSLDELVHQMLALLTRNIEQAGHDPAQYLANIQGTLFQHKSWRGDLKFTRQDGVTFDAGLTVTLVSQPHTHPICTVTLIRDISQEKALQAQKDRFIANASHELRTPITNMKMRLYLLRKQRDRFDGHMAVLDMVSDRMQRLVENLLDVSRFERGVIVLQREPVVLQDLVDNVMTIQRPQAENQGLTLTCQSPAAPITLTVDPGLITQVITNLVTNAINYTGEGGQVTVDLALDPTDAPTAVFIRVRDTGIGIPAGALDQIFEPFFRVNEHAARGTGLGLTISREIVGLHQGQLTVESREGEGSTFTVRLSLADPG